MRYDPETTGTAGSGMLIDRLPLGGESGWSRVAEVDPWGPAA